MLLGAAAELEAQMLTVITGGIAESASLDVARQEVEDGLGRLDDLAASHGVKLGLEPIHPIGMLDKGCINSIAQAKRLVEPLDRTGLIIDFFHSWWDVDLLRLFSESPDTVRVVQISNVSLDTNGVPSRCTDLQTGVLSVHELISEIRRRGYNGPFEFEIFARDHDGSDTIGICARAVEAFDKGIAGHQT